MFYSYIRQLHGLNPLTEQQRDILSFSLAQKIEIDKEVIEYSGRALKFEERKEFEAFLHSLLKGDCIIVSHLAVVSHYTEELIKVITCVLSRDITLYVIHPKIVIDSKSKLIDVLPVLDDLREAEESKTTQIGRPKGSRSSSKFDIHKPLIVELLRKKSNVSKIARALEVSRSSLKDYIESRNLREVATETWIEVQPHKNGIETKSSLLICPFEQEKTKQKVL